MDEQTNQPSQPIPQNPSTQNPNDAKRDLLGRTRLGLLILGVIGLTIFGRMCSHKEVMDNVPDQSIAMQYVSITTERQMAQKTIKETKYVPPEGSITISPKDPTKSIDDLVKIKYEEMGFVFEPGIQTVLFSEPNLGLDCKLFYAYRFGVNLGFVAGNGLDIGVSPTASISYRLDQIHLRNTEIFVGYVPLSKFNIQTGFRINL